MLAQQVLNQNHFQFSDAEYKKMKDFECFVDYVSGLPIEKCEIHLRAQSSLIDLNMVDYLGRMESFESDARYIFNKLGLADKEIVKKNVTSRSNDYQKYYSDHLAEKVAQIYRKDIQLFGYQF